QPYRASSHGSSAPAIAAPNDDPVNSTPNPASRRSAGNTRDTVWAADGNDGDSARPSAIRSATSPYRPGTSAWVAATSDQTSTAIGSAVRAPTRSTSAPERGVPTRYASENADTVHANWVSFMSSALVIVGASAASACRSTNETAIVEVAT